MPDDEDGDGLLDVGTDEALAEDAVVSGVAGSFVEVGTGLIVE